MLFAVGQILTDAMLDSESGGEVFSIDGKAIQHWRAHDLVQLLSPLAPLVPDIKVYFNVGGSAIAEPRKISLCLG